MVLFLQWHLACSSNELPNADPLRYDGCCCCSCRCCCYCSQMDMGPGSYVALVTPMTLDGQVSSTLRFSFFLRRLFSSLSMSFYLRKFVCLLVTRTVNSMLVRCFIHYFALFWYSVFAHTRWSPTHLLIELRRTA